MRGSSRSDMASANLSMALQIRVAGFRRWASLVLLALLALPLQARGIDAKVTAAKGTMDVLFTVGGYASGISGSAVLQLNGGDDLTIGDGAFTFAGGLSFGSTYSVTVASNPINQTCLVVNSLGEIEANVTNIIVSCVDLSPIFIGGTVTGAVGNVTLQLNGGGVLVTGNGTFTFAEQLSSGAPYEVTVASQPQGQTCTVTNGSGIAPIANVINVNVNCVNSIVSSVVPIPALTDWTLLALAMLLVLVAFASPFGRDHSA